MLIILYYRETVTLPKLFTTYRENENVNRVPVGYGYAQKPR